MSDTTGIGWCDATFNPWWGCVEVSTECDHCYAATLARRRGLDVWGKHTPRQPASESYWDKPLAWNRDAERQGRVRYGGRPEERPRVFCASMADVFETHPQLPPWRDRLWNVIERTPELDWLLLTKRPRSVELMVPWGGDWPANVWIGTSIGVRAHLWRADVLRQIPAAVRFLSAEPLLESLAPLNLDGIDWVISGGESGAGYRPLDLDHVREIRDACQAAGVPHFFKQVGGATPKAHGKEIDGREWCEFPESVAREGQLVLA